ncbi:Uncharacterised protein [Klebsiella oxytoca]|uniref:Uncharacterized protein n=1 Tax=Klebsiella oxytoca TaxID=571 RepID=A0A6N3EDT7_KLEOX
MLMSIRYFELIGHIFVEDNYLSHTQLHHCNGP